MNVRQVFRWTVPVLALAVLGCGPGGLKQGELVESTKEMRVSGESVWEDGTTEEFAQVAPAGTVFRVLYNQRSGLDIIEVVPVKVRGKEDPTFIAQFFLPPHLSSRIEYGFKGFSLSLPLDEMGSSYKRLATKKK